MATPDYDALIRGDLGYTTSVGDIIRRRIAAALQYGDASAIPGADAQTIAAARANPYSTLAQLAIQHMSQNEQVGNAANSRGLLSSGQTAQGFQNEAHAALQRSAGAALSLTNYLSGLTSEETGAYANAYARLAANPPGLAQPAAAPAAPVAQAPVAPAPPPPVSSSYLPVGQQLPGANYGPGSNSTGVTPVGGYPRPRIVRPAFRRGGV